MASSANGQIDKPFRCHVGGYVHLGGFLKSVFRRYASVLALAPKAVLFLTEIREVKRSMQSLSNREVSSPVFIGDESESVHL
jgi:hypothetical protein